MEDLNQPNTRTLVKRLARQLNSDQGAEILASLQLLRQEFMQPAAFRQQGAGASHRIGVWHLDAEGKVYRRRAAERDQWRFWADVDHFPLRTSAFRVLLLGESAARAFLYDPKVTLAQVIERYLGRHHSGPLEVIDLARTDLNSFGLLDLMAASACLSPDAVVLFAGNNWLNFRSLTEDDVQGLLETFDRGFGAARHMFEKRVLPRVCAQVMDAVQEHYPRAKNVIVVPEFNLGEWREDLENVLPVGDYQEKTSLLAALADVLAASQGGDLPSLAAHCDEIEKQTGKTSYLPFYVRGRMLLEQGRDAEAAEQLNLAKDSPIGIQLLCTPRCPTVVQAQLRELAQTRGFGVVDLPRLMRHEGQRTLPGYDFFLDYCHLNLRGLNLIGREVARQLFPGHAGQGDDDAAPEAPDSATTYFLAAIHCAHFGQGRKTIRRLLARAIELDPGIKMTLELFLRFQSSATPRWMHRDFARAAGDERIEKYLCLTEPGKWDKFADYQIYEIIAELISGSAAERDAHWQEIARSAAVAAGPAFDLLADRFAAETFRQCGDFRQGVFHRSQVRKSSFFLPLSQPETLELTFEARLPPENELLGAPNLVVSVNGGAVASVELTKTWRQFTCEVALPRTVKGVNRITLAWPDSFPPWPGFMRGYLHHMTLRQPAWPEVLPVYGEIFAAQARIVL